MTIQFDGTTGVSSVGSLTVNGDLAVSGSINSTNTFGFKNRIINGAMVIDQRNNGASVNPVDSAYTLDRWNCGLTQASKFSVQQSSVAPIGFTKSLLATSLSAYSVGASDLFRVSQFIEGNNVADLNWGTANAQTVTLSFFVYSSLTGTFGGSIANSAFNRSYPFTYAVSSANTWTQVSITIPGDQSGTWLTTNGIGIRVNFSLGAGSSFSTTANAWAAGTYTSATGAVSVVGTSGATFYITGVQLEKGSVATGFDYRPYGTELALCQRYLPAYNSQSGTPNTAYPSYQPGTNTAVPTITLPVTARVAPTGITISAAAHFSVNAGGLTGACSAIAFGGSGLNSAWLSCVTPSLTVNAGGLFYMTNAAGQLLFTGCEL